MKKRGRPFTAETVTLVCVVCGKPKEFRASRLTPGLLERPHCSKTCYWLDPVCRAKRTADLVAARAEIEAEQYTPPAPVRPQSVPRRSGVCPKCGGHAASMVDDPSEIACIQCGWRTYVDEHGRQIRPFVRRTGTEPHHRTRNGRDRVEI